MQAISAVTYGSYYVVGSWSDWSLQQMAEDQATPGLFNIDVKLSGHVSFAIRYDFRILRNKDWQQVFYPTEYDSSIGKDANAVGGPDDNGKELYWNLSGKPGDVFRIEFQREVTSTSDTKKVSWRKVEPD